jgi:hypothetical protein
VRRRDIELQLLDEHGQPWRLAFGQLEDEPGESSGVDDRMLERALQPAADKPRVERVVAVLDQHRALGKPQEASPGVLELGRDLEHQEGRVACGLHVEGDELGLVQRGLAADLGRVDRDLLPGDEVGGAARLEVERTRAHLASASARLAHAISSALMARRRSTATA